ncbi:MAG: phosphatidate cytidylyltransferase [Bacteroidota bacterium]
MTADWINTAILSASFLALFGLAELLYHKAHVKVELTRKLVHLGTGALTLLFPLMLSNHWFVLLLCASFALILIVSLRFNWLPSINAIDRVSVGSLAYPVSVYGCYLVFQAQYQHFGFFYIPILTLAICDPIAALAGKRWPLGKYTIGKDTKTIMGSSMFLLSAFAVYFVTVSILNPQMGLSPMIFRGLIVAIIACAAEAVSGKGTDNLTIPAAVLGGLYFTNYV